jgi:hypothetical protein
LEIKKKYGEDLGNRRKKWVWGVRVERVQATEREREVEGMTAMASFSLFFFADSSPFLFKTIIVRG